MQNKSGSKRNVQMRVKGVAAEDVRLLTNEAARSHGIVYSLAPPDCMLTTET